jgi:seryl-tRNA synthetase
LLFVSDNSRTELTRNNDLLAKRLNKKKEEAKMLRNKLKRVTSDTIKYRQAINHLMQQRKKLHLKLGQVGQNVASLNELLAVMKNEGIKLKKDLDSLSEYYGIDDLENMSYLANTTLMTDLQKTKTANAGKTPKKGKFVVKTPSYRLFCIYLGTSHHPLPHPSSF